RLLAHGEGLARFVSLALDDDALEHLYTAAGSLDDLEVHLHPVTRGEAGNASQLGALDGFDDAAHGGDGRGWSAGGPTGESGCARCNGSGRPSGSRAVGVLRTGYWHLFLGCAHGATPRSADDCPTAAPPARASRGARLGGCSGGTRGTRRARR